MSRASPLPQSRSNTSLVSNTTYHSFHNIEEQYSANEPLSTYQHSSEMYNLDGTNMSSTKMHRQDSGYESISPRDIQSSSRSTRRRASSMTSSRAGSRVRPPTRRAPKAGSVTRVPKLSKPSNRSLLSSQSKPFPMTPPYYGYSDNSPYSPEDNAQTSYFQFPPPGPETNADVVQDTNEHIGLDDGRAEIASPYKAPPQTTHYWTSDRTRRLEYAAIDAASRGFKGWVMRHIVPDCFVPKAMRRVAFDDDTGSVRRYRIELESDESASKDVESTDLTGRSEKKKRLISRWP